MTHEIGCNVETCFLHQGTFWRYACPMFMKFFRNAVVLWMIAWLPASGAMAAVMPIAGMLAGANTTSASSPAIAAAMLQNTLSDAAVMPCHGSVAEDAAANADSRSSDTCTHCVLCHLAGSLMLSSLRLIHADAPSHDFSAEPLLSHASFVPDLASPPPRKPSA